MADELKDQRIPIMMSPSEVKAIDDWMFARRIKSRAEAIRRLCQIGLSIDEFVPKLGESFSKINTDTVEFTEQIKETDRRDDIEGSNRLLYAYSLKLLRNLADLNCVAVDLEGVHSFYGTKIEGDSKIYAVRDFLDAISKMSSEEVNKK